MRSMSLLPFTHTSQTSQQRSPLLNSLSAKLILSSPLCGKCCKKLFAQNYQLLQCRESLLLVKGSHSALSNAAGQIIKKLPLKHAYYEGSHHLAPTAQCAN